MSTNNIHQQRRPAMLARWEIVTLCAHLAFDFTYSACYAIPPGQWQSKSLSTAHLSAATTLFSSPLSSRPPIQSRHLLPQAHQTPIRGIFQRRDLDDFLLASGLKHQVTVNGCSRKSVPFNVSIAACTSKSRKGMMTGVSHHS